MYKEREENTVLIDKEERLRKRLEWERELLNREEGIYCT